MMADAPPAAPNAPRRKNPSLLYSAGLSAPANARRFGGGGAAGRGNRVFAFDNTQTRRRLTFSDTNFIIEIPRPSVTVADIARLSSAAFHARAAEPADEKVVIAAWRQVAENISSAGLSAAWNDSCARQGLTEVFKARPARSLAVLDIAAAVLKCASETFGSAGEVDDVDGALADAVLGSLARGDGSADGVLDSAVSALEKLRWVEVFPEVVAKHRAGILVHVFGMLGVAAHGDIDVYRWRSLMRLIRGMACAGVVKAEGKKGKSVLRDALLNEGAKNGGEGRRSAAEMVVRRKDVSVLLRALEKVGGCVEASEETLRTLAAVCGQSAEVAAMAVGDEGAGVVREVAGKWKGRCPVQAAAVDLLAAMATQEVMYIVARDGLL